MFSKLQGHNRLIRLVIGVMAAVTIKGALSFD